LQKLNKRIILFLDNDNAGQEASKNILVNLLSKEIDCEIIVNNYNIKDPDDICCNKTQGEIQLLLTQRKNPFNFIIEQQYEKMQIKDNPQRINSFINEIYKIFSKFKFNIHTFLINKLSQLIN